MERQKYYDAQAKSQAVVRKAAEDITSTKLFRPQIDPTSVSILSDARPEMLLEGPEERFKRMSDIDKRRIDAHRLEKEKEIYNENDYSFAPNIDKVSRILGRTSSIDELYENKRGQRAKLNAARKAEDIVAKECSFRPKINATSSVVSFSSISPSNGREWDSCPASEEDANMKVKWLGDEKEKTSHSRHPTARVNMREPEKMARDIRLHLAEKEELRREILAEREISEIKDCTFRPNIPKYSRSSHNAPVVVRGIARHLELQSLSERKRSERAEREEAVFRVKNVKSFKKSGDGSTVVEVSMLVRDPILICCYVVFCRCSPFD